MGKKIFHDKTLSLSEVFQVIFGLRPIFKSVSELSKIFSDLSEFSLPPIIGIWRYEKIVFGQKLSNSPLNNKLHFKHFGRLMSLSSQFCNILSKKKSKLIILASVARNVRDLKNFGEFLLFKKDLRYNALIIILQKLTNDTSINFCFYTQHVEMK